MTDKTKGILFQFLGVGIILLGLISLANMREYGVWASILGFALFSIGSPLLKMGAKLKQLTADELLEKDTREPILLLRPFKKDDIDIRELTGFAKDNMFSPNYFINKSGLTFEEKIVETFNILSPIIAIGRPNEGVQPLGASRTYVPDSQWQDKVIELASKSSYILFIVDDSPSLRWEFHEMVKLKSLDRLFLIMPPLKKGEEISSSVKSFLSDMNIIQNIERDVVAITFDSSENIKLIKSTSNNILKRISEIEKFIKTSNSPKKIQTKKSNLLYKILLIIMIGGFGVYILNIMKEREQEREYRYFKSIAEDVLYNEKYQ